MAGFVVTGDVGAIATISPGFDATVVPPGSKSLTNRALVCASLATGTTALIGPLDADDTRAMRSCVTRLGATVAVDDVGPGWSVSGPIDSSRPHRVDLYVGESGTTARFIVALCATTAGEFRIDADDSMRARPMWAAFEAIRALGVTVESDGDMLPAVVRSSGATGGSVDLSSSAEMSSQFVSGLMMAGAAMPRGLAIRLGAGQVSPSYISMTASVMESFGASVDFDGEVVATSGGYRPRASYFVEPDASAASYFMAAAAICDGTVRIPGLGAGSLQGDVAFAHVLGDMGADVEVGADSIRVTGTGTLRGVTVDMSDLSDTAPTLAAIAPFASTPTEVTGVGFVRHKETDRIRAVVAELNRCGVEAHESADGFTVMPGMPTPATIETYGDHRMAMSFAVMGLRSPGIRISDPDCVNKTFPGFWGALADLGVPQ